MERCGVAYYQCCHWLQRVGSLLTALLELSEIFRGAWWLRQQPTISKHPPDQVVFLPYYLCIYWLQRIDTLLHAQQAAKMPSKERIRIKNRVRAYAPKAFTGCKTCKYEHLSISPNPLLTQLNQSSAQEVRRKQTKLPKLCQNRTNM